MSKPAQARYGRSVVVLFMQLAEITSINFVCRACSFFPAVGNLTAFLSNVSPPKTAATRQSREA